MSHKKRNGGFSVPCDLKVPYLFTTSNKTTSAEENDTKIIEIGWVILILWPLLKQSFSNFTWFLRPMSKELCREGPFMWLFEGSPLIRVNKRNTVQQGSTKHYVKGPSRHNSSLIGRKNQVKFENDCVLRNGHRIKITEPNSMILVSFSSVENALFNDVNNYYTFSL